MIEPSSAERANSAEPQPAQKALGSPPSGTHERSSSSPATTRADPGSTRAFGDAAVPVRRWQRVQWQYAADRGGALTSKRTRPQPQPPVSGSVVSALKALPS